MRAVSPELHLLTGVYALDAVADEERAAIEAHLPDCPACAEEIRGLRETAARLAMATAVSPPPAMRAQVLAALPRTRQLPPSGGGRRRQRLRRLSPARAGLTAAVLGLAAALVFLLVTQVSTSDQLHQQQAGNRAVAAVLAAPDATVESVPAPAGGRVSAVISVSAKQAVLTSARLPSLAGGHVYQLWVISASGPARSAGLLTVTPSGSAEPVLARAVVPGDQLGITVEPAGGSPQPTTAPIAALPVSA